MSNALAKTLEKSMSVGSLSDLVRTQTSEVAMLAIDCSGSMNHMIVKSGRRRIEGLRDVVTDVRKQRPETRMIRFGGANMWGDGDLSPVAFVDEVPEPSGGTPLTQAIELARENNAARLVVISDGEPDDKRSAIEAAKRFGGTIDIVFVGDDNDIYGGRQFLLELAQSTGGTSFTGDLSKPKELGKGVVGLLEGGKDEEDDSEPIAL